MLLTLAKVTVVDEETLDIEAAAANGDGTGPIRSDVPVPVAYAGPDGQFRVGARRVFLASRPIDGTTLSLPTSRLTDPARGISGYRILAQDPANPVAAIDLNWGDGSPTETFTPPYSSTSPPSHTYADPGTYQVTITVHVDDSDEPYFTTASPSATDLIEIPAP